MTEIVRIPFHGSDLLTVDVNGKPHVILKPAIERLGVDYKNQHSKLQSRSWACMVQSTMQLPGDAQARQHTLVDVRTFLMLLATIDERRVAESSRALLIAYQAEVADAIEAYWTQGGAINPRATEDQLDAVIGRAKLQSEILGALKGVVHPDWLDAHGRIVASRALGIEPELDPATRPLTVDEFLAGQGVPVKDRKAIRSQFGKRLAGLYLARHGEGPTKGGRDIGGRITEVNVYSERHRDLFAEVWEQMQAVPS